MDEKSKDKEVEKATERRRPWFVERYTLQSLTLALLAVIWSLIALVVVIFDKDFNEVWVIASSIIAFYFGKKNA